MADEKSGHIVNVMKEERLFAPTEEFSSKARFKSMEEYQKVWDEAAADPVKFWGDLAKEELHWFKPFDKVLEWNEPFAKWFVGGKLNVSHNCLDRHVSAGRGERMRPLSDRTPKPLLKAGGKPLIEHHLLALKTAGVDNIVVNTGHSDSDFLREQAIRWFDRFLKDETGRDLDMAYENQPGERLRVFQGGPPADAANSYQPPPKTQPSPSSSAATS